MKRIITGAKRKMYVIVSPKIILRKIMAKRASRALENKDATVK